MNQTRDIVRSAKAEAWREGYQTAYEFIIKQLANKRPITVDEPLNPYDEKKVP